MTLILTNKWDIKHNAFSIVASTSQLSFFWQSEEWMRHVIGWSRGLESLLYKIFDTSPSETAPRQSLITFRWQILRVLIHHIIPRSCAEGNPPFGAIACWFSLCTPCRGRQPDSWVDVSLMKNLNPERVFSFVHRARQIFTDPTTSPLIIMTDRNALKKIWNFIYIFRERERERFE